MQGQLARAGGGSSTRNGSATTTDTEHMIVTDQSRSAPPRRMAFQLACSTAAPSTRLMTRGLIRGLLGRVVAEVNASPTHEGTTMADNHGNDRHTRPAPGGRALWQNDGLWRA